MKKTFLSKLLISAFALTFAAFIFLGVKKMQVPKLSPKNEVTFISLVPSITEIIYALNLENNLLAVSDACNWPEDVKNKEQIGSMYNINNEKIIELSPKYLLALISAKPFLQNLEDTAKSGIEVIYFEFNNVNDIFAAIVKIGEIGNKAKEADLLNKKIKGKIKGNCKNNPKKILYLIQTQPLITIGSKSYITDVIRLSGNKSISAEINSYYPAVSQEYVTNLEPDIVVVDMFGNESEVKRAHKMFKNAEFIELKTREKDIINRPGPRVGESVEFFESLCE
jgi:iron complex transport system substrate-binding protein